MSEHLLEPWDDRPAWDAFVRASPQGTVFTRTGFLDALGVEYELLHVHDGEKTLLAAPILRLDGEPVPAPLPFTLYQGLMLAPELMAMPPARRVPRVLRLVDAALAQLTSRHDLVSFCLHPAFEDARSFQWFNYHAPERGQFEIAVRYTGVLAQPEPRAAGEAPFMRSSRRQDLRRSEAANLEVRSEKDVDELLRLRRATFARQGITTEDDATVESIARAALRDDFGELLTCRTPEGRAASAALFLFDDSCAYYLLGASDPELRNTGSGTRVVHESIRRAAQRGLTTIDFVGVNSPQRGDFKVSFNATPTPYLVVTWRRP